MNYDDLADMLTPIGDTIVPPGGATAALPCITLEPLGMSLQPGVKTTFDRCNICVRFSMGQGDQAQFDRCRQITAEVIRHLKGTQVLLDPDVDILSAVDVPNPAFYFQISAAFPGIGLCSDYLVDPADGETYLVDEGAFLTHYDTPAPTTHTEPTTATRAVEPDTPTRHTQPTTRKK